MKLNYYTTRQAALAFSIPIEAVRALVRDGILKKAEKSSSNRILIKEESVEWFVSLLWKEREKKAVPPKSFDERVAEIFECDNPTHLVTYRKNFFTIFKRLTGSAPHLRELAETTIDSLRIDTVSLLREHGLQLRTETRNVVVGTEEVS